MRCVHRYLPSLLSHDCRRCSGGCASAPPLGPGSQYRPGTLRLQTAPPDRPSHVEGRRPVRPLRPVCRAMSHGGVGHAEIPIVDWLRGSSYPHRIMDSGINDFAIKLANVNGSGSASANSLIMQAIFRMGVPVSGKNLFPSNIQGLPTWYEIRVNKDGYTARALNYDLMVAMNAQTYERDVDEVRSGGYILYDSSWPLDDKLIRDDVTYIGVPLAQMCNENFKESRERVLMKNIATAGVLIELLNIDRDVVQKLVEEKYGRKKNLQASNQKALSLGADYVREHYSCPLPFHLQTMNANSDK